VRSTFISASDNDLMHRWRCLNYLDGLLAVATTTGKQHEEDDGLLHSDPF
jgi:hypothetical protein